MARRYIPERGDIVWLTFAPQAGHEQSGRRPALVLSPAAYNAKTGLGIFCPITSKVKGYPFEVAVRDVSKVIGVVLSDQIKSLDWRARRAAFAGRLEAPAVSQVLRMVNALLSEADA